MTIKRIQVKETTRVDVYNFEGKLEQIISELQEWMNEDKWEGIEVEYDLYGNVVYSLYKHREETDKEYNKRIKQLEKEKADKAKAKERKLKQLKKDLASLTDDELKQLGVK
jgi:hypothetical protein